MSAFAAHGKAVAAQIIDRAKKALKGVEVQVQVAVNFDRHLRFARNGVTTSGVVERVDVQLALKLGQRVARSTVTQLDAASVATFVDRVVEMVKLAPEDPEAQPFLAAQKYLPSPYVLDRAVVALPYERLVDYAAQLIEPSAKQGLQAAGFLSAAHGSLVKATSAGLLAIGDYSQLSLSVTSRTKDGLGSGRESWTSRSASVDAAGLGREAAATAVATSKPTKLDAGKYTVVLEPEAAGELVGVLVGSLDARAAEEGRSCFSKGQGATRLGETLFPAHVTLASDHTSKLTPGFAWDGEGLALKPMTWVDKGVLVALSRSRAWAAKTGKPATGDYGQCLLSPGTTPRADLLKGIKRGVLVKRLWYTNLVEPKRLLMTGLTRDGTFLIEDGAIVSAVNNFRINESVFDLFERCDAIAADGGATSDVNTFVPALRTHDFTFSSVSDAV